jgi:hypothetical protein
MNSQRLTPNLPIMLPRTADAYHAVGWRGDVDVTDEK